MLLSIYSSAAYGFLSRTSTDLGGLFGRSPSDPEHTIVRGLEQSTIV
ncbi:hypothetical protein [Cryobacterium levicorallinum]|nr:hypothetical protein [Cryobacterium levicorallinum]